MHAKHFFYLIVAFVLLIASPVQAGEQESLKNMANIMMHLNHFPSDAEKKQLSSIADSTKSAGIKVIANAMINLQHSASAADKKRLQAVIDDENTPENVKTLASIVQSINHKPTRDDKQKLSTMVNFASDM